MSTRPAANGTQLISRGLAASGTALATLGLALLVTEPLNGLIRWATAALLQAVFIAVVFVAWKAPREGSVGAPATMMRTIDESWLPPTIAPDVASTDAPSTDAPRSAAPSSDAPSSDVSSSDVPWTDVPGSDMVASELATMWAPTSRRPAAVVGRSELTSPAGSDADPGLSAAEARLRFDERLEGALDAARNEDEVLGVISRAAETIGTIAPTEVLLAGARGTTIVQAAETGPEGEGPGCPVPHPGDCEAMRLGTTRRYPSSNGFDACPHLRDRLSGPCAATCVPVRVLGRSIGVVHRVDPVGHPADDNIVATLESLASKSGARLSLLRAAVPTSPAAIDPSTGLLDRASTERRVIELGRDLTPFSLAQGDIDHFRDYLRVYGREMADKAIRLMARVIQEILRPGDVVGRFGEDEFLVVLPNASDGQAQRALERVREHLALTLASSSLAPFTISFGVVESSFAQTLEDLLVAADIAVSLAKDLGRNRVVVADEEITDPLVDGDL